MICVTEPYSTSKMVMLDDCTKTPDVRGELTGSKRLVY